MVEKYEELYRGKAKTVYKTANPEQFILHFRDDTSAFDGTKLAQLSRKGMVNNIFNAYIMTKLAEQGVNTHFIKRISDTESLVKQLDMIPIECVVRNIASGSLCRRLAVEDGLVLEPPLFEFFLKNDALHDPLINDAHIICFSWATQEEIDTMRNLSFKVNAILKPMFLQAGLHLVDYKLEFGRYQGQLVLGDEFTPDGCRIWDVETRQKLDKDRYRQDLGDVIESYEIAAKKLGIEL